MTVLSNRALIEAMDAGRLRIDPRPAPTPEVRGSPFGSCSVDLHLGRTIFIPRRGLQVTLDIRGALTPTLDALYERREIADEGWVLEPGRFLLGRTIEVVDLPLSGNGLAARIEGRSSFARAGLLVHFTAPTIHAGFTGSIALEIINLGEFALVLRPGSAICQLIVETVEGEPIRSDSQFQHQSAPTGAAAP
ncbi:MAG: dCTP deaminase [Deltaproteobacteria bacterium]|nr:dCTP deaminase [Deltaproteobacteria bacterium]